MCFIHLLKKLVVNYPATEHSIKTRGDESLLVSTSEMSSKSIKLLNESLKGVLIKDPNLSSHMSNLVVF